MLNQQARLRRNLVGVLESPTRGLRGKVTAFEGQELLCMPSSSRYKYAIDRRSHLPLLISISTFLYTSLCTETTMRLTAFFLAIPALVSAAKCNAVSKGSSPDTKISC